MIRHLVQIGSRKYSRNANKINNADIRFRCAPAPRARLAQYALGLSDDANNREH